jgi:hypothetical protein
MAEAVTPQKITDAPDHPSALLQEVLTAHGGVDLWRTVRRVDVRLRVQAPMFLFRLRLPRWWTFTAQVDTRNVRTVLTPFPAPGQRGVYEGDDVRIESETGQVVARLANARADATRRVSWTELHVLYFFGYAFWNYVNTPFFFLNPGFELAQLPPVGTAPARRRRLHVRFPPGLHTHSPEQTFYFDDAGLLRRLDYTADIFGPWARGAHVVDGHEKFQGIVYPTHRFVLIRAGSWPVPAPLAIEGLVGGVDVVTD